MIAFLLIVGLSFGAMASILTSMVGDYLYEEKITSQGASLESLASRVAPAFCKGDTAAVRDTLREAAAQMNARILLCDADGKVQADTQGLINGHRLDQSEVASVLVMGTPLDYAVHRESTGEVLDPQGALLFMGRETDWDSYCAAAVVWSNEVIGALVQVTSAETMMRSLYQMRDRALFVLVVTAIAALVASLVLARVITRPINRLMRGIQHMSRGDFSSRVVVKGSGEMRRLAQAFNSMSEKVETLDQSRNQFVSNASHELKTPLATMKIMIQSLIYQPEMDRALRTEFLTDIDKEIDRLSAIISDLLTLVKMDSSSITLTKEELILGDLCADTRRLLAPMAEKKKQRIILDISDPCLMTADKSKLTQVVYNLVENAVKYTQEGGEIRVSLARVGRDALLTVSDNGPGIPKEALPHVFDRFFRVDKARSREGGGTGLGLSIVKQFVALHGGDIRAESELGKGSSFIVTLPLRETAQQGAR